MMLMSCVEGEVGEVMRMNFVGGLLEKKSQDFSGINKELKTYNIKHKIIKDKHKT